MKTLLYIFSIGLLCCSCNNNPHNSTGKAGDNSNHHNNGDSTNNYDETFIKQAAQGNLAEVAAGKLAVSKAQHAEVKMFGDMMVTDHQGAFRDLKEIAAEMNVTIPDEPEMLQKNMEEKLGKLSGKAFDIEYMDLQVMDHETTVALFEKEVNAAQNEKLKAYAINYLPALRMHLDKARSIAAKLKENKTK